MWGDAFLVSPVVKAGQTTKDVYLPNGTWINFWTDDVVQGGKTITVATPLERMPLFVKAGSIIPTAAAMNYSDERPLDTLTLRVYPAESETSSFTLYEDDGKTLAYQSGSYARTTFTQSLHDNGKTLHLSIGPSLGEFAGKLRLRCYIIELHGALSKPLTIRNNGRRLVEKPMTDFHKSGIDGFSYDKSTYILLTRVLVYADSSCQISIEGTKFRR